VSLGEEYFYNRNTVEETKQTALFTSSRIFVDFLRIFFVMCRGEGVEATKADLP